ncbi:tyrosine-type recombinase/integrase [Imbroritus primus]|uniref:tyrosine-type recombinase/integrase n=1 Tax=Imbroritus primus TaxID=3058603 RepID=UPI003D161628
MGGNQQFEGVYAREASILISFHWEGRRHRERLAIAPTTANLRAAARLRDQIVKAIEIDKFTLDDFATHFPDSAYLRKVGGPVGATFEVVVENWLTVVGQDLAATTVKEYRNTLARHFQPDFDQRQIASISYEELALHLAAKKIRSGKTFNNIMTPVRGVFAYALKTKRISIDPTLEIPARQHQKAKPDPLEVHEIELVLDHLRKRDSSQWLNYFEFAFFTGLRPSELIALKWSSVDFLRKRVTVESARVRAVDKDAKTHRSRDVDLQSRALAALKRQKAHTFMAGEHVFHNPATGLRFFDTGAPVQDCWRPTLKAVGLRDRDAKQTRHSFATMCLHAGMNPAYVARQMGHIDTRMFFEVYSKWIDGQANDREISKLDALFSQSHGAKSL